MPSWVRSVFITAMNTRQLEQSKGSVKHLPMSAQNESEPFLALLDSEAQLNHKSAPRKSASQGEICRAEREVDLVTVRFVFFFK